MDRVQCKTFEDFHSLAKESHHLPSDMPFTISYTDPRNGDLLPITNDENLQRAFTTAMPLIRLFIYRKQGEEGMEGLRGGGMGEYSSREGDTMYMCTCM